LGHSLQNSGRRKTFSLRFFTQAKACGYRKAKNQKFYELSTKPSRLFLKAQKNKGFKKKGNLCIFIFFA
jgi:hypothetical protein